MKEGKKDLEENINIWIRKENKRESKKNEIGKGKKKKGGI